MDRVEPPHILLLDRVEAPHIRVEATHFTVEAPHILLSGRVEAPHTLLLDRVEPPHILLLDRVEAPHILLLGRAEPPHILLSDLYVPPGCVGTWQENFPLSAGWDNDRSVASLSGSSKMSLRVRIFAGNFDHTLIVLVASVEILWMTRARALTLVILFLT